MSEMLYKILYLLKRLKLGIPLHLNEEASPFFIIGSGRSGNTLLRRILNQHSRVFIPAETYVLGRSIKQAIFYPFLRWIDLCQLILSNFHFHPEGKTFNSGPDSADISYLDGLPTDSRSVARIVSRFYEKQIEDLGKGDMIWGDKTPLNSFFLNEIYQVFPKARFIYITRDPLDVVHSYVSAGLYLDYAAAAKRWAMATRDIRKFQKKYPHLVMSVTYEDLVRNPEYITQDICTFLQLPFEASMLKSNNTGYLGDVEIHKHHAAVLSPINTGAIGKGKQNLTSGEIAIITKEIRKILGSGETI